MKSFVCANCRRNNLSRHIPLPKSSHANFSISYGASARSKGIQAVGHGAQSITGDWRRGIAVTSNALTADTAVLEDGSHLSRTQSPDSTRPRFPTIVRKVKDVRITRGVGGGVHISPGVQLEHMLQDPERNVEEIWSFFLDKFGDSGPARYRTNIQDRVRVERGDMFKHLLELVVTRWSQNTGGNMTTPSEAIRILETSATMKPEFYVQTIWVLLKVLIKEKLSKKSTLDLAGVAVMEQQLMIVWSRVFQLFCRKFDPKNLNPTSLAMDWSSLPDLKGSTFFNDSTSGYQVGNLSFRVSRILSRYPHESRHPLAAALLVTFGMFGPRSGLETESPEYKPFMSCLASILYHTNISRPLKYVENALTDQKVPSVGPVLQDVAEFLETLKKAPLVAMVMIATRGNQPNRSISLEASRPDIARDSLERHFISMLGRVDEKSRFGNLEELWANARSAFTLLDKKETALPLKLYHLFIRAAYRMRNHNAAVEIWNDMVVNGVQPTVTHWTEMIHGAGSMKDLDAVENMWQRMLDAGVKPDAVAWTARIRSTMRCARTNRGLSLLEEWSREWVTAAETYLSAKGVKKDLVDMGDLPGVPKPTPQTLNTVLKGLIDKRQHKRIQQLMGWAASCGILPDEYTFNLLIGMHMRDGQVAEAMAILDQMPAQSIEPSVVTFTILIDGIYQSDAASLMTPDTQATIAEQVLEAMESRGTEANLVTYGALINGLLHHQNIDAAKKVLAHMHARGKAVPPQVHTVLMKYFFNHYNTESGSVKDLWANLNTADLKEDALFFNTMVQGFANAHEFDLTLRFLSKMSRNGMDPSWTTLTVAVKALMDAGQRDRVQAIVDGAATAVARGGMDIGSGGQPGTAEWHREAFWRLVESLGLKPSENVIKGF